MILAKCVYTDNSVALTKDKIYDVISFDYGFDKKVKWIEIKNDEGINTLYYIKDKKGIRFVDIANIREKKLKQIGIN